MFYLLKFTYEFNDTDYTTHVVLDEDEYIKFRKYNGQAERFNYDTIGDIVACTFVGSTVFEKSTLPFRHLLNNESLHRNITYWISKCDWTFYLLSFACMYKDGGCEPECTRRCYPKKEVLLTREQYSMFKSLGGEKHVFTLFNDHMRCDNGHSIYTVWVLTRVDTCVGRLAAYDMTQAVYRFLGI